MLSWIFVKMYVKRSHFCLNIMGKSLYYGRDMMGNKAEKHRFEVEENETIADCLERMAKEGYRPIRRMEEPIFQEVTKSGKKEVVPVQQRIIFEGVKEE